jgi:hypothetical protein
VFYVLVVILCHTLQKVGLFLRNIKAAVNIVAFGWGRQRADMSGDQRVRKIANSDY